MRGRRFLVIEDINTLEQPETFLESESCLRRSVRTLYFLFDINRLSLYCCLIFSF